MANDNMPVDTLGSNDLSKPLVFYISGDGGFNSFSTAFMREWNAQGYPVLALNAKTYFWKTKSPDAAVKDIRPLLLRYLQLWKRSEIIIVGYSFGADVTPFLQTRFPPDVSDRIRHTVLLSPSETTDFTIHLFYNSDGENVPAEINRLTKSTLVIFGADEDKTPEKQIINPKATVVKIAGDHHYDNHIGALVSTIVTKM